MILIWVRKVYGLVAELVQAGQLHARLVQVDPLVCRLALHLLLLRAVVYYHPLHSRLLLRPLLTLLFVCVVVGVLGRVLGGWRGRRAILLQVVFGFLHIGFFLHRAHPLKIISKHVSM